MHSHAEMKRVSEPIFGAPRLYQASEITSESDGRQRLPEHEDVPIADTEHGFDLMRQLGDSLMIPKISRSRELDDRLDDYHFLQGGLLGEIGHVEINEAPLR